MVMSMLAKLSRKPEVLPESHHEKNREIVVRQAPNHGWQYSTIYIDDDYRELLDLMKQKGTTYGLDPEPFLVSAGRRIFSTLLKQPKTGNAKLTWFSVWSPSVLKPLPRFRPTASSSSMKMMDGACFLASLKRSLMRLAPLPTNISTNSLAHVMKNGTPAFSATARASNVFPVPGGPTRSTPRGILAPRFA
uniref:Probable inactive ATP-dependent zinc metalloprotease FTSHI 3, chloroplastic isoform X2 n=1 Tax=Tanacetum cinerariifolium TaxID=118510 RepID=A0A699RN07_TANCI|nr:probable inactive ATP-dependent zinc metalloprotease FTSHI 3, chloroplastic isoform X2 [Tanacetum cinerariifolium]